jgi:hypothetical protein
VCRRAFGTRTADTPTELDKLLRDCTVQNPRVYCYIARSRSGVTQSAGAMNVYPELSFAMLWAGGTIPEARGCGSYSTVVAARVHEARKLGLRWVGLYARTDTSSPIVAKQGFRHMGTMTYWLRPP